MTISATRNFPIESIRSRFPSLHLDDRGIQRIYLDNPAGTQVPREVMEAVTAYWLNANANQGGAFTSSLATDTVTEETHRAMADFMGANDPEEIIIGTNMTTLTLHFSRSICRDYRSGDEIIVTTMDHEGNVAPWLEMAEDKGCTIRKVGFDTHTWQIEPETIANHLTEKTKLVALNYASNLTGSINQVKQIVEMCHAKGALVYVDAVQYAPHGLIDVQDLGCDFLVCSAYKFFGPHLGILWGKRTLLEALHAYKCRCVPESIPDKFETGTPSFELQAGLTATVNYFSWLGSQIGATGTRRERIAAAFKVSKSYEDELTVSLITGLQSINGLTLHGITEADRFDHRVPTVSFTHDNVKPATIAQHLSRQGIFVWNGHNYALEVVRHLGIPEDEGVVRIGLAHYNTMQEISMLLSALKKFLDG